MKWLQRLQEHVGRLWTSPGQELGRGARFVQFQLRLWHFCARRLRENNAMAMSSALSFRTIFALVPAIVLAVVVARAFGLVDYGKRLLRQGLEQSGLSRIQTVTTQPGGRGAASAPAASQPASRPQAPPAPGSQAPAEAASQPAGETGKVINVAEQIEGVVNQVESKLTFGRVGPIGLALLIWSALTLATTVERSLNRIFGAPRSRSLGRRVLLYWAALTLGPMAFALADYAGNRTVAFFGRVGGLSFLLAAVGWIQPVVVGVVVLVCLYIWVPNTHVSKRAAFGGAVVAFPAWLVARWAFSLYVREVVGAGSLYGSLGLLPLFLLWLNLSWWIFLFGAEIAHTAVSVGEMAFAERAERTFLGPWELLAAALAIAARHASGAGPATADDVAGRLRLPQTRVEPLLDRLVAADAICRVERAEETAYVPSRAPAMIRVDEVLGLAPPAGGASGSPLGSDLAEPIQRVRAAAQRALADTTLADLLDGE